MKPAGSPGWGALSLLSILAGAQSGGHNAASGSSVLSRHLLCAPPASQTMAGLSPGLPFIPPIGPLSNPGRSSANPVARCRGAALCAGQVPVDGAARHRLDNGQLWGWCNSADAATQSFLWGKLHEDQWWAGARPGGTIVNISR